MTDFAVPAESEFPAADDRCAVHHWHPDVECEGSPSLARLRHPLFGPAWACLPHAVHGVRSEPRLPIIEVDTDAVGDMASFASEIRHRAWAP